MSFKTLPTRHFEEVKLISCVGKDDSFQQTLQHNVHICYCSIQANVLLYQLFEKELTEILGAYCKNIRRHPKQLNVLIRILFQDIARYTIQIYITLVYSLNYDTSLAFYHF